VWAQLKAIEARLGLSLLAKQGRRLVLTEEGERVARVADELFALGQEVLAISRGHETTKTPLRVGVVASLPRLVARRLITPAIEASFRLVVQHGSAQQLLGDLAAQRLDVVLSDELAPGSPVRAHSRVVGHSKLALYGTKALRRRHGPRFPRSLEDAPMLLPLNGSAQRQVLDQEFSRLQLRPTVVAEIDDSALLKALAAAGLGLVPAPELVAAELLAMYQLVPVGTFTVRETYVAVTLDRRRLHPAVEAMLAALPTR
jgi:LysR family transcriptional activator of nhaA